MSTRPGLQTILTARATGSSSSLLDLDSLLAASFSSSFWFPSPPLRLSSSPRCCCWNFLFRLAERDQTFSRANATPVWIGARHCHLRSSSARSALTFSPSSSTAEPAASPPAPTPTVHSVAIGITACTTSPCLATAFPGLKSPKLHATAQRRVFLPAFRFVTAKFPIPCSRNFATSICTLASRPSIDEYHRTLPHSYRLSARSRETNPMSPPGQIISFVEPVQTAEGAIDLCSYADAMSAAEE